ncbi:flagella synthesis protein FlgN [Halopseudomonas phragmitis]|uniref:Flagellar protein FlgN n=1 Tax=Halopseudomonas phragmitis TaxID=1931241 RepID=A0A1V0B5D7_9GAMM|nr:flagellar protein FlgN [Halopseudomonas phragmitis]AQZ95127.1 hypothetical protein BVH74_10385 [Halopseudomonas phragmitis]
MQDLNAIIERTLEHGRQFIELLDQELAALSARDLQQLDTLVAAKAPAIEALSQLDSALTSYCQSQGLAATGELERHIHDTHGEALHTQYRELLQALQQCREANERNARLVHHNQHVTVRLLDMLRNQGEPSSNLYDRLGQIHGSQGRPLSKA